jgi:DNA adenine methylase
LNALATTPVVAAPIVKAVGGKSQLLPEILPRLPAKIDTYYEPFCGGAAVFFALAAEGRFRRAVLGDSNSALINMYIQVRDNCSAVIQHLHAHDAKYSEEYYYQQRSRALDVGPAGAARTIFLNKTGFNGLFRVNADGGFNVPFGHHKKKPRIVHMAGLRAASRALENVKLVCTDYATLVARASVGDVCFMDPPYIPASATSNFTGYTSDGFDIEDQERLADCVASVVKRGANVLLSNSDTPESRRIFGRGQWQVEKVSARRSINSDGAKRGAVGEILVSAPKRARKVVK